MPKARKYINTDLMIKHCIRVAGWPISNVSEMVNWPGVEKGLIDAIVAGPTNKWDNLNEYHALMDHFKNRGDLMDRQYFYNNLMQICKYRHGIGYNIVYIFCKNVLKRRLPSLVEASFFKNNNGFGNIWAIERGSRFAYKYAKYVVRGRLPIEYEEGCGNFNYLNYISSKGYEISDILIENSKLAFNFYTHNHWLPEDVHNSLLGKVLIEDPYSKIYFKQLKFDDKVIRNRLIHNFKNTDTVSDILNKIS